MPSLLVLVSVCALALSVLLPPTKAKHKETHVLLDAFQIMAGFPGGVAIFDEDQDGDLDCVTAVRTDYSNDPKRATYVWFPRGQNGQTGINITYHLKPGATPETADFLLDESVGPWKTMEFLYSDDKDCIIFDIPYKETEQCMLWVSDEAKDEVPQRCSDKYKDICEYGVLVYDKESCGAA